MGRVCEVSGKKTTFGNHVTTRGKAKYLGGVGIKCTGRSRRTFEPNLQNIKIWLPNGKTQQVRVATSVIRTGSFLKMTFVSSCALPFFSVNYRLQLILRYIPVSRRFHDA